MADIILYFAESGIILAFFYLIYMLVLRRETFFSLNRFFLLGILLFSLMFPLLSFDLTPVKTDAMERSVEEIRKFRMAYYEAMAKWAYESRTSPKADVEGKILSPNVSRLRISFTVLLIIYIAGIVFCLSRTLWTFRWIGKMITRYPHQEIDGLKVVKIPHPIAPFSFLKYVFVHDAGIITPEFEQILAHERAHIKQGHSIDLILVQILAAFYWFNPVIWQLIKSLKTTHEFIADEKIINSGYSTAAYQNLLLSQLISNNIYGLAHNFNLSFIKKRIDMMKIDKSGWQGRLKVVMAIAVTLVISAIILRCNSKLEEQDLTEPETAQAQNTGYTDGIILPVLPGYYNTLDINRDDELNVSIAGDLLTIDGKVFGVDEIVPLIEKTGNPSLQGQIVMRIDKDQNMKLVRAVQMELRKARRRKILYVGQTPDGKNVELPLLLPPTPENAAKYGEIPEPDIADLEAQGRIDILKLEMGNNDGPAFKKEVYDFVKNNIQNQSSDYVVSAHFRNEDTYNDYLVSLKYIREGFDRIYNERSQRMFKKDYPDLSKDEFLKVRKDVPMAISIAE